MKYCEKMKRTIIIVRANKVPALLMWKVDDWYGKRGYSIEHASVCSSILLSLVFMDGHKEQILLSQKAVAEYTTRGNKYYS